MENKEIHNSLNNENRIIKNLYYDSDRDLFIMADNQNNTYLCDMFGRQKSLFKSKITGISNRYQHSRKLQPLLIKNITQNKNLSSPIKLAESSITPKYQKFNTISNQKSIDYHPYRKRYPDGCGLPKSLIYPFFNEKMENFNKKKLIEHLNVYFSNEICKNNVSFDFSKNKLGLSFITCNLNDYKLCEVDHKNILKLIDNTIEKYREKYKYKLNILYKNPVVKAITGFKKYILLNKDTRIINGCRIDEPLEEIKEKYKIINNNINNYYHNLNEINKKNEKIYELYKLNKFKTIENKNNNNNNIDFYENENELYNETQTPNNQIIVGPDKLNNICKSKDFTIGRLLEMDFGFSEEDHKNKANRIKRLGNSAFRSKNNNKIIKNKRMKLFSGLKQNKNNINIFKKSDEDQLNTSGVEVTYKETVETLSNKNQNINDIYINNNNNSKTLEQKIADNELSFMSDVSEREKNNQKKRIFRIKSVNAQRIQTEIENKMLEGFHQNEPLVDEEEKHNNKKEHKFKNSLECYKNDINLLKITNPKAYEMQKKAEEHEYSLMKKKMELLAILEQDKIKKKKNNKKMNE